MEQLKEKTEELTDHVSDYVDTLFRLTLTSVTERITVGTSAVISTVALLLLGVFSVLFGALALAWWIGNLTGSRIGGFLIVAACFLVLFCILFLTRKSWLNPKIRDAIVKKIYE